MGSARPSQATVERAIRAADKLGLRPRAMDLLPDGRVRLLFEEPDPVAPSAANDDAVASCDDAFGIRP